MHAALDDAEQARHRPARHPRPARLRADQRSDSSMDSRACRFRRRIRRALVEHHRDVRAERALDLHRALGIEEDLRAVDRRAEAHALLRQLAHRREAEDLVAAGVGQDRPLPVHHAVQAAVRAHDFRAGPQHQVKGVREDDLGAAGQEFLGRDALDGPVGADRHEGRRFNRAAREREPSAPRARRRSRAGRTSRLPRLAHRARQDRASRTWHPRS